MAKRILVVEDNEDSRFILVATLHCIGYETIEAKTGTQGVEKALSEKPDLIVMDLGLPGMSGIDAARAVKENLTTAHIPIIACSALSPSRWKEEVLKVGMVDYLEKPVSWELMKATIEKFIVSQEKESGKKARTVCGQNKNSSFKTAAAKR
jgi:two-component system, cell cycle response regulator DivK